MVGVRPICVGLIVGVMISLSMTNYVVESAVSLPAIGIALLDLFLLLRFKLSIPKVILISAVLGLVFFH